jgi:hypothetical protein
MARTSYAIGEKNRVHHFIFHVHSVGSFSGNWGEVKSAQVYLEGLQMVRRVLFALLAATTLLALPTVNADTLLIDGLNRSKVSAQQRPKRGMSMNAVESTWGQPIAKRNAIGEPPISRWEYSSFIVYFEYSHVIHAVAKN